MNLTAVRKPAVERRPVVRNAVQRSAAAVATPTPARVLQNRVGNRAVQAVVAPSIQMAAAAEVSAPSRSTAPGPGAPSGEQAAVAKHKPAVGAPGKAAAAEGEQAGAKGEARPVAGGEAEAPAKKKAPSAREAVAPTAAAVRHRATGARTHSKADIPVSSAQAAAISPATEQTRGAAQATVAGMDAAGADKVRREAFKASLKAAIEKATPQPKTEDEAERVQKQGAAQASSALRGELTTQRDASAGPMKAAALTEVAPDSQPAPKGATLEPEPMGKAPAPVSGASVVPEPLPAEQLDYSSDREPTDRAMADAGVTKAQLDKGNEPQFGVAVKARSDAEKHGASVEAKYRTSEGKVQGNARVAAEAELAKGIGGMHEVRGTRVGKVVTQQNATQVRSAAERKRVTDTITGIKNKTKTDVDQILKDMDDEASKVFEAGLAEAERVYEQVFEDEKGGVGTWLTTWGSKWEKLIERSLGKARQAYLRRVDDAIDEVATCVDAKLAAAKRRVADGRKDVETFVAGLDDSVKGFGKEALESVSADFDALETDIDQRRDAIIDKLAEQYKASYERMSAMEEKLREENKSLWQRVYDATVGLIKKILAFKDMLLSILAKAADVITDIISDPIGFLGNLVSGVMLGLKNFMGNIGAHLKKGLMDWLFGALGGAGLVLPDTFDLKGIVSIVLQVLGLTYANFRARAVKIVGEPVVAALEQAAEVFKIVITEGIPGLWRFIKEKLADLKSMVLDAIFDFIKEKVIIAGVTWVIGLLNPASAFFKACKAIYDIVMFFIERGSQIIELVNAVIDSMASIAKGNIAVAATFVENALAKAIPVAIGFLASLLGLGDISGTIRKTIEKAQAPVNNAIDWVIHQAVKLVKAAGKFLGGLLGGKKDKKGDPKEPVVDGDPSATAKVAKVDAAIEAAEAKYLEDGAISEENARKVGVEVKGGIPDLKSIQIVDGGGFWDYQFEINPKGKNRTKKVEDGECKGIALKRPGKFWISTKEALKAQQPSEHEVSSLRLKKGLARRHIISSHEVITHFVERLTNVKKSTAVKRIDAKGSKLSIVVGAKVTILTIQEAAQALIKEFFNETENLWVGDSAENSSIQEDRDYPPSLNASAHVRKMKAKYFI
jgi:hypothetical protein